jgi:hypothetical protein
VVRSVSPDPDDLGRVAGSHPAAVRARIIDPLNEPHWDEWVSTHADATIFHTSAWARVLVETYRHRSCYLQITVDDRPLALVPLMEIRSLLTGLRGVCLPFSDFCPPLMSSSFGGHLVLGKLRQLARERSWDYFELRGDFNAQLKSAVSQAYFGHKIDLASGSAAAIERFNRPAARALRKAERNGLVASVSNAPEGMTQFYRLHVQTRRRHGAPPQPRSFFENIQKYIIQPRHGFTVLVSYQEKVIAAAIFFVFGRHAIYKFGASDRRWQHLRPNNQAMATAICYLADSSIHTLHLGRTDKHNQGLRQFKLSLGAQEEEISYGKFSVLSDTWLQMGRPGFALHSRIFRVLPLPLNRLAGNLLYPHLD